MEAGTIKKERRRTEIRKNRKGSENVNEEGDGGWNDKNRKRTDVREGLGV